MEDTMTRWRVEAGDLFELRQRKDVMPSSQKEAAIDLLTMLLMEALRASAEQDFLARAAKEADHDDDRA
jgi:hypothetical protein